MRDFEETIIKIHNNNNCLSALRLRVYFLHRSTAIGYRQVVSDNGGESHNVGRRLTTMSRNTIYFSRDDRTNICIYHKVVHNNFNLAVS